MFKAKIIIGVVFSLIVADLLTQIIRYYFYNPHLEYSPAKSVTMAGYSPQRTGVIKNDIPVSDGFEILIKKIPHTENANEGMPLFVNAKDLTQEVRKKMPAVKGQYLIFTTKDGKVISYDLIQNKIFWSLKVDWNLALSSPAISISKGRIYLRNYNYFFSIKLDGSDFQKIPVNLQRIIIKNAKLSLDKPRTYDGLDCTRTSLGINEQNNPAYLYQGCSYGTSYGKFKGATGYLFAIYLDKDGRISTPIKYNFYNPSPSTSNPKTGFNTGLWNSGMGPTLTDNNQLLLATGNGPIIPEEKNYGCSIVRIDGKKLKVKDWKQFYSLDYKGYSECLHTNSELGSSSIAYKTINGKEYGVITGKDGYLRVFNPNYLPANIPQKMHEIKVADNSFGQPLLYSKDGTPHIIIHSRRFKPGHSRKDFFLATDQIINVIKKEKLFDGEIKKIKCLGYLQKEGLEKNRIDLFYSGRIRRDFVALKNTPQIAKEFSLENLHKKTHIDWYFQSPYKKILNIPLGHTPQTPPANFQLAPMTLNLISPHSHPNYDFYSKTSHYTRPPEMPYNNTFKDQIISNNGSLLIRPKVFCDQKDHPGLNKINLYQIRSKGYSSLTSWVIDSYYITPDLQIKKNWRKVFDNGTRAMNSNIAAFENKGNGLIVLVAGHLNHPQKSVLHLFSLKTGKLVQKYLFPGRVHFTMPLIVGNKIFVATEKHGIQCFILKFWNFKKFFYKHSFLWKEII